MLEGIHPLLSGELLHHLDDMGHSDAVVIADAHFPAASKPMKHRPLNLYPPYTPSYVASTNDGVAHTIAQLVCFEPFARAASMPFRCAAAVSSL